MGDYAKYLAEIKIHSAQDRLVTYSFTYLKG